MKYYKDKANNIYAYESDSSQDEFINDELVRVSEQEAIKIANPPLSKEQLITEAEIQKQSLLGAANIVIAPLQDAIDLDMATDEEKAQLIEWKKYRVLLNRVDTSTAPDIEWPEKPE